MPGLWVRLYCCCQHTGQKCGFQLAHVSTHRVGAAVRYIACMVVKAILACGALCAVGALVFVVGFATGNIRVEAIGAWLTVPYTVAMGALLLLVVLGGLWWPLERLAALWRRRRRG